MRQGIIMHLEEHRAHYTSIRSDNGSKDFFLVPKNNKGTIG